MITMRSAFRFCCSRYRLHVCLPKVVRQSCPAGGRLKVSCQVIDAQSKRTTSGQAASASQQPADEGIRFVYEPPNRKLVFRGPRWARRKGMRTQVDTLLEGRPAGLTSEELHELAANVSADAGLVMRQALRIKAELISAYKLPRVANLSLVLCDDAHIHALNFQHRNKDVPTDVLSFDMGEDDLDHMVHLPIKLLGDLVISLDTAQRQAAERGYSLLDEVRVLLVHGMLHLCGFDHERGEEEHQEMAAREQQILAALGWKGAGLISAAESEDSDDDGGGGGGGGKDDNGKGGAAGSAAAGSAQAGAQAPTVGLGVLAGITGSVIRRPAPIRQAGQQQQQQQQQRAKQGPAAGSTGSAHPGRYRSSSPSASLGAAPPTARHASQQEDSMKTINMEEQHPGTQPSTHSGSSSSSSSSSSTGSSTGSSTSLRSGSEGSFSPAASTSYTTDVYVASSGKKRFQSSSIRLVALDMDGTLLDGRSKILPSSVKVIKAACKAGIRVILATGKARPAAIMACSLVGLHGDELLVSKQTPGIFLQGLAVHGRQGRMLSDAQLPRDVVANAFRSLQQCPGVSLVAFSGDKTATLQMTEDLQLLHTRYYEPLAQVQPSLEALLNGPAIRKLLFMADPKLITEQLIPMWTKALDGSGASVTQAVPDMLEVVPHGVNKWAGAQVLLQHLGLPREAFMAVGDGGNDYELVANAGLGVAMGNAVEKVKKAAAAVVASNDEHGIAEAFEKFVL